MAGPGAGTPEHRTMRGLPEEVGGGRGPERQGHQQDRRTGLSGRTWYCWELQWEIGMVVSVFETPCDEVSSSS